MISNLAYEYIDEIPWNKNPEFSRTGNTEEYINAFKNVIDVIPTKDTKISFNDDIWDFNKYLLDSTSSRENKFIFSDLNNEIKDYCKFFIIYGLMSKNKISTINVRFTSSKSVYSHICNKTSHKSIFTITTDDIKNEITNRNISASTKHNLYEGVYQFYDFLFKNYKLKLPVDITEIKRLGIEQKNASKRKEDESKIPNIPSEYFSKILNMSLKVMKDNTEDYTMRMTAALIVLLSQTGLRLGDLLSLKTDALVEKKLSKSGNIVHYIHYTAKKPSKAHSPLLEFDIFSNKLATESFQLMVNLREEFEIQNDKNHLYVLPPRINSLNKYPIERFTFNAYYQKFMYTYLYEETQKEWSGIKPTKHKTKDIYLNIPETRQYRVHLATDLYNKGVPLIYIQKYMAHLSEYMLGYYVRPKDTYQENIKYSEQVIKEITEEDLTPLGGSLIGEDIKNNIQKFINDNNFNVNTDIDSIMKELGDKVIIRGKTGGVCIKTSLMPCAKDARTNEMMCAYNLCPNLFHFYYMIDVSYLNFKTLQDTYEALKKNNNIKAAQKELNKLKDLLKRRLIPELDELEKELDRKGFETIINQHPSLVEIIENKDNIREEIELWMNKK